MQNLRWLHRWATLLIAVFTLYLGVTGTLIQGIDLKTILSHAPASDPDLQAIRESFDGPGNYQVREARDYLADPLPDPALYPDLVARTIAAARDDLGAVPLGYVELRMMGDRPVGAVGLGSGHAAYDPASGARLERTARDHVQTQPPVSTRNDFKHLHRMTTFGDWALVINIGVSIGLTVLIVTGLWIYARLWAGRRRIGRSGLLWDGGGAWRALHRWVSIIMAAFLMVVTASGAWLAVESAWHAIYQSSHRSAPGKPAPAPAPVTPITDAEAPAMLAATLDSARRAGAGGPGGDPVKVVRLRHFGGYAQGVVVTGGDHSRQLVFDTASGRRLSTTEPGYLQVPFPFGWEAHQIAKSIHRGDWFGLTGRWCDLLAGLAMIYLSVSGLVMYRDMWRRRAASGRRGVVWR
jgi:uncharacterized iron-regulated membrane protein